MKKGKLLTVVFLCLLAIGCSSCATTRTFSLIENPSERYTVPSSLPDFSKWLQADMILYMGDSFRVTISGYSNPKNVDETVLIMIGREIRGNEWKPYVISLAHIPSIEKFQKDDNLLNLYADERYLEGGIPSFVFTKITDITDEQLMKLIEIKEARGGKI